MDKDTNSDIFIVAKRNGDIVPFLATTLSDARSKAAELGGKRYRFISILNPSHPKYAECVRALF